MEKEIDSKEYVNLTHYLTGSHTTFDEHFQWRFRSQHTFCVQAEAHRWQALDNAGLLGIAQKLVNEAKTIDVKFLGHEGGENNDPEAE